MSGKGERSSHKSKEEKDRKKSYLSLIPMSCYKVKEVILEKLILNGHLPLFRHLMREKLFQHGWVYQFRSACQDYIKRVGIENTNVSHMMTDMLPVGKELFSRSEVKQQLLNLLKNFALMYFNSDPSALVPEYSSTANTVVQYQSKDVKPEPRKRTHSHDRNTHSHNSKRSRSSNRSRSRNRSNQDGNHSKGQRGRSSSGSGGHGGSRSRSPVRSPIPPRPITPQPPVLPPVLRVERLERVVEPKPMKSIPRPRKPPPPVVVREPREVIVRKEEPPEDDDDEDNTPANEEEEEELPDI
ncbi:unnamed protein product [Allacma fusca]|uniref:Uncharacterized protein n=1 Tax=Allacma fusca TaxID=39272 RepID=A0A8J2P7N3_9HEXA|nr:unnamed protein product [Allacma fusca]